MTQITDKITAFELPEGAENIRVSQLIGRPKLFADLPGVLWAVKLPPGTWRFLFTTKTATEEDARKAVEEDNRGYKYYWDDKGFVPRGFNSRYKTALESLHSLLRSKGLDPDKNNYAIIEKESSDADLKTN